MKKHPSRSMPIRVLVTAGPTREKIDPVRYVSNRSTGSMGYHIASVSRKKGMEVCLVSGPVDIPVPRGVDVVKVETAREMLDAVRSNIKGRDCLIMAAAVSDYRPAKERKNKIKKKNGTFAVKMVRNSDILRAVKGRTGVTIGFALETNDAERNARAKLREKGLDAVVVNVVAGKNDPFGEGRKCYKILYPSGKIERYRGISKKKMAGKIVSEAERLVLCKRKR